MRIRPLSPAVASALLVACASVGGPGMPAPTPTPAVRTVTVGRPQVTLADPTDAARAWQIASAVTRAGGVVVIGVDDIALRTSTGAALSGTLALATEAVEWGRSVVYLTTNPAPGRVRADLLRAGYPRAPLWTPSTARWCGRFSSDAQFRVACIAYLARREDVVLWLTRGQQPPNAADRTYAFPW